MTRKCINCHTEILDHQSFYQIHAVSYDSRSRCRLDDTGKMIAISAPRIPYRSTGALSICARCYCNHFQRHLSDHMDFLEDPFD